MDYGLTLNLPKTGFPMKANLSQKELEILKFWEEEKIYEKLKDQHRNDPAFILHDGPPYANGHIHLGTAFNKIIKDIIIRSKTMSGLRSDYVPGWDCHGLPIEHQVDKNLGPKKKEMTTYQIRQLCREYAQKFIAIQREEFKRLGVFGDWENPYLTMSHEYESAIIREFGRFVKNSGVYKGLKPVHWCSSCRTALAEAEVEYADHSSPSICVKFPILSDQTTPYLKTILPDVNQSIVKAFLLIWTTTPWTLPANLAIALHPEYEYAACQVGDEIWFMAKELVPKVMEKANISQYQILTTTLGRNLEGIACQHPFYERKSPIFPAYYVTLDQGTGCVHIAPGHGQEDYELGLQYGLPPYAPVNQDGKFTQEVQYFADLAVFEANAAIIQHLKDLDRLAYEESMIHSYPHCWRCKKPVIFRATEQWFISMDKNNLRTRTLEQIKNVSWIPAWGETRITGMIENRPDWCISRQRVWGVPITAFYCQSCGHTVLDGQVVDHVADLVAKEGIDIWFQKEARELLPEGFTCPKCQSREFIRDMNILDVWFDSGVSFAAVLETRANLACPADLYLEGSDQHRGWFHSSILAAVGTRGVPPYRSVLTHGFVVDGQGKKMSKSAGNVIAPQEVIKNLGAEILRLWVCSEDYKEDIRISGDILNRLSEAYRRIRNTCRYLLGNLSDFNPETDQVAYQEMEEIDQWIFHRFQELITRITQAYQNYEFHIIFHSLHNFCTNDLSAFYLDVSKDRMYTSGKNSGYRRSGQTVVYEILVGLVKLMAPVLSFTSEEIWKYLPEVPNKPASVHLTSFPEYNVKYVNKALAEKWDNLLKVRSDISKVIESARAGKIIGHSLDAKVDLLITTDQDQLYELLKKEENLLKTILIISGININKIPALLSVNDPIATGYAKSEVCPGLFIRVEHAEGEKCARCWKYEPSVGKTTEHPNLCVSCASIIKNWK